MSQYISEPSKQDQEIVAGLLNGTSDAAGWLADKYSIPLIRVLLWRYGSALSREDAEEIVWDTFLTIVNKIDRFDPATLGHNGFRNWIYAIATRKAIDRIRQAETQLEMVRFDDEFPGVSSVSTPGSDPPSHPEHIAAVQHVLDQMNPKNRQVLFLWAVCGLEPKEISQYYGGSPEAIRTRLTRARNEFRTLILQQPEFAKWASSPKRATKSVHK
jgi:RNA polymerase sigma-70 factor (ECF subfamily)